MREAKAAYPAPHSQPRFCKRCIMAAKARSKLSQSARVALCTSAASGVGKYFATTPSLVLAAVSYTPAALQALLSGYGTTVSALQLLHGQLHTAVAGEKAQAAEVDGVLSALESQVINTFGEHAEQVTEFGFPPRKVAALTAEQKAQRAAKAKATRAAKKAALAAATVTPAPATSGGSAKA
jgi:hypothetical protein